MLRDVTIARREVKETGYPRLEANGGKLVENECEECWMLVKCQK